MRVRQQRGDSRLATLFWFAVIGLGLYMAWNVAPAFYKGYILYDRMVEICRLGRNNNDDRLRDLLWKEVVDLDLVDQLQTKAAFKIRTQDYKRQISVEWDQELKWLPGFKKVKHFEYEADQPVL